MFAPHFASPLPCRVVRPTPLLSTRNGGEILAELAQGELFEVLEFAGSHAWGRAPGRALVGYLDRTALSDPV